MNHREVLSVFVACRISISLQLWDTRSFTLPFPTWGVNSQEKMFIMRKEKDSDGLGWFWNGKALGAWCRAVQCERPQQCWGGESEMTWCDKRLRPNQGLLLGRSVSAKAQKRGTAQRSWRCRSWGSVPALEAQCTLALRQNCCTQWTTSVRACLKQWDLCLVWWRHLGKENTKSDEEVMSAL